MTHNVSSGGVLKVSSFNKTRPREWFKLLESHFHTGAISDDATRYGHLLAALDGDDLLEVLPVIESPPEHGKYDALKKHILRRCHIKKDNIILLRQYLKPSELLKCVEHYARAASKQNLVRALWLSRLPWPVQEVLATSPAPLCELSVLADRMCDVTSAGSFDSQSAQTKDELRCLRPPSTMSSGGQLFKDGTVQTDYDACFEKWYKRNYSEAFAGNTELATPALNDRKTLQTLFVRGEHANARFSKISPENQVFEGSSSSSLEPSKMSLSNENNFKTVDVPHCWVDLNLFDPSHSSPEPLTETNRSESEYSLVTIGMEEMSEIQNKSVQTVFDEFKIDEKLQNQLKYFENKVGNNKLMQTMLTAQTQHLEKIVEQLRGIAHAVAFNITDDMLDEILEPWKKLVIEIQSDTDLKGNVPLNLKMYQSDVIFKNCKIYLEPWKIDEHNEPITTTKHFEHIFLQVDNENEKHIKTSKTRDSFLRLRRLLPEYHKKVKAFIRALENIFSLFKSFEEIDSQSELFVNELVSNILRPEIPKSKLSISNGFIPEFPVNVKNLKYPELKIDSEVYFSKLSKFYEKRTDKMEKYESNENEDKGKGKNKTFFTNPTLYAQNNINDYHKTNDAEILDLNSRKHHLETPVFNIKREKTLRKEVKQKTRFLQGVFKHGDGLRVALKTIISVRFDVSQITSLVSIEIEESRSSFLCNIKSSNKIHLKSQCKIKLDFDYQLLHDIGSSSLLEFRQNPSISLQDHFSHVHIHGITRILHNGLTNAFQSLLQQMGIKERLLQKERSVARNKVNVTDVKRKVCNTIEEETREVKETEKALSDLREFESILNIYKSLSSCPNKNVSNLAIGDSINMLKKNKKACITIKPRSYEVVPLGTVGDKAKTNEVLHQAKTDNWQFHSSSTLAMSEEYLDARCTCYDEIIHTLDRDMSETGSEVETGTFSSTLALSDKHVVHSDNKTDNVNVYNVLKASQKNQKQFQEDQELNKIREKHLRELKSVLEVYKYLD